MYDKRLMIAHADTVDVPAIKRRPTRLPNVKSEVGDAIGCLWEGITALEE